MVALRERGLVRKLEQEPARDSGGYHGACDCWGPMTSGTSDLYRGRRRHLDWILLGGKGTFRERREVRKAFCAGELTGGQNWFWVQGGEWTDQPGER